MMVDTTIYGYVNTDGAFHVNCAGDPADAHDDTWSRLYYLDDEDPHGLTCDACYDYIFEPVAQHVYQPTEDGGNCRECYSQSFCGEGAECSLHIQPEPEDGPDPAPDVLLGAFTPEEQGRLWHLLDKFEGRPDWTH